MKFAYLERIFSFLIVIFMILSLALVTVFALFGQGLIILIFKLLNIHIQSHLLLIFNIIKSLISFLGYFSFFLSLFYLAPSIKMRVGEIIPELLSPQLDGVCHQLDSPSMPTILQTIINFMGAYP
ncbi:MAG: hypothetical protein V8T45_02175 [Oscillospiraceae bacterium]